MTNNSQELALLLRSGLRQLQLDLDVKKQQQLLDFAVLLAKWSKVYNLTTLREPQQIIINHILDSLSVTPFLGGSRTILDVGTGAGLPGIPLAIACPDVSFILLDSQQKKINFVQHVITSLQLTNVTAVQQRVETLQVSSPVDMVISRAFASLAEFVNLIGNVCGADTKIIAMKGRRDLVLQEQQLLPPEFELVSIETLIVPNLDAERCLVFLKRRNLQ